MNHEYTSQFDSMMRAYGDPLAAATAARVAQQNAAFTTFQTLIARESALAATRAEEDMRRRFIWNEPEPALPLIALPETKRSVFFGVDFSGARRVVEKLRQSAEEVLERAPQAHFTLNTDGTIDQHVRITPKEISMDDTIKDGYGDEVTAEEFWDARPDTWMGAGVGDVVTMEYGSPGRPGYVLEIRRVIEPGQTQGQGQICGPAIKPQVASGWRLTKIEDSAPEPELPTEPGKIVVLRHRTGDYLEAFIALGNDLWVAVETGTTHSQSYFAENWENMP